MLVNFHDHFEFYKDLESGIDTIRKNNIITLVNSMTYDEYKKLKKDFNDDHLIKIGLGIHPWKVEKDSEIDSFRKDFKDCDFIGEIGLDFYWDKRENLYDKQRGIFEKFLYYAKEYNKVTNIHTKGAEKEIYNLLKKYELRSPIIHWYSGDISLIKKFLDLEAFFTIGPDFQISKLTDEIIKYLPLDRILTETDGPTSIEWARGFYKESDYIKEILKYISQIKKIDPTKLEDIVYNNYLYLKI